MKHLMLYEELFGLFKKKGDRVKISEDIHQDIEDLLIDLEDLGYEFNYLKGWDKKLNEDVLYIDMVPSARNNYDDVSEALSRIVDFIDMKEMNIKISLWFTNNDNEGDVFILTNPNDSEVQEKLRTIFNTGKIDEISIIIAKSEGALRKLNDTGTSDGGPR